MKTTTRSKLFAGFLSFALVCNPLLNGLGAYATESGDTTDGTDVTEVSYAEDVTPEEQTDQQDANDETADDEEASAEESTAAVVTEESSTSKTTQTEEPKSADKTEESSSAKDGDKTEASKSADKTEESSSAEDKKVEDIDEADIDGEEGVDYVEGKLLITYEDDVEVNSDEAHEVLDENVTVKDADESDVQELEYEDENIAVVEVSDDANVAQAVQELSEDPRVEEVQPDYIYTVDGEEDGEDYSEEDGEDYEGEYEAQASINDPDKQDFLSQISAYQAWDTAKANKNVSVAVIDTGVDIDHEDLASNIVYSTKVSSATGSSNGNDDNGHGTHVSGIIAAKANNGVGVAGVSYNAGIVGIKANTTSGGTKFTSSSLKEGFNVAISKKSAYNIRVINLSIASASGDMSNAQDKLLIKAIDNAYDSGILVVGAAGNYSSTSAYPCDYTTKCLGVMALNNDGTLWSKSNYNGTSNPSAASAKNLCAPGKSIYSTYKDNSYSTMSGTSMSAPIVSGVAALVFAADSSLSPSECAQIMYDTALDYGSDGWDQTYGYGMVNAYGAVLKAAGKTAPTQTVYRLFNPDTKEHHYTKDANEVNVLTTTTSWRSEGIAWKTYAVSTDPVYRLYDSSTKQHHYTTDFNEWQELQSNGWTYEGIAWYSGGSTSVYRLYNPEAAKIASHHYTKDSHERSVLLADTPWTDEGIGWYSVG